MTIKKAGVLLVVILALALAGCGGSSSDSQSTAASQNGPCLGVEEVRIAVDKIAFGPNAESEAEDEQQEKIEAIEERGCQAQK